MIGMPAKYVYMLAKDYKANAMLDNNADLNLRGRKVNRKMTHNLTVLKSMYGITNVTLEWDASNEGDYWEIHFNSPVKIKKPLLQKMFSITTGDISIETEG